MRREHPPEITTPVDSHVQSWTTYAPRVLWTYRELNYLQEIARQGYASGNALDMHEMKALASKILGLA